MELHTQAQPESFLGIRPEPDLVFRGPAAQREDMGRWYAAPFLPVEMNALGARLVLPVPRSSFC